MPKEGIDVNVATLTSVQRTIIFRFKASLRDLQKKIQTIMDDCI